MSGSVSHTVLQTVHVICPPPPPPPGLPLPRGVPPPPPPPHLVLNVPLFMQHAAKLMQRFSRELGSVSLVIEKQVGGMRRCEVMERGHEEAAGMVEAEWEEEEDGAWEVEGEEEEAAY